MISRRFPAADVPADAFTPTPDQVALFKDRGFLTGVPVLDGGQLEAVRAAVDDLVARLDQLEPILYEVERAHSERPGEVVCHFLGGWLVHDVLSELVFHPAVTVPAATLLGVDALRFWHDQAFVKPAGHPGVVPWHQDMAYWGRTEPECHITVNVMLDDATEENGCLQYVPGSHRGPLLPPVPFDAPLLPMRGAVLAPVRAGQATIHLARTRHGSGPNRSDRPRRAVALNYMGAHVRSAIDRPLLRGVAVVPVGATVEGPNFPIVWRRS